MGTLTKSGIIDEVGKNISGQGMDPTVTGRASSGWGSDPATPSW